MAALVPDDNLSAAAREQLIGRLPAAAVRDIAAIVEEERIVLNVPTAAECVSALDAILAPLQSLASAISELDEMTSDVLDAHAFGIRGPDGSAVAKLKTDLAEWARIVIDARAQQRKRQKSRIGRQLIIARRLQAVFLAHRVPFAASPTSKAAAVLGIILAELGLPASSPGNYVREVLKQGNSNPRKGAHLH